MKINDSNWEYTVTVLTELKEQIAKLNKILDPLELQPESPLYETPYKLVELVIDTLEKLIKDDFGNINWFIWENNFGENKRAAGLDDNIKPIETTDDLRWLIELNVEK